MGTTRLDLLAQIHIHSEGGREADKTQKQSRTHTLQFFMLPVLQIAITFTILVTFTTATPEYLKSVPYQLRCTNTNLFDHDVFDIYKNRDSYKSSLSLLKNNEMTAANYLHYLQYNKNWSRLSERRKKEIEETINRYIDQ